jgi:hypothetical protein
LQVFNGGADEFEFCLSTAEGEPGILGEKTVAWVNAGRTAALCRVDQFWNIQVIFAALPSTQRNAFVRRLNVHGIFVRVRINRNRLDSKLPRGTNHAERDFPAIRD